MIVTGRYKGGEESKTSQTEPYVTAERSPSTEESKKYVSFDLKVCFSKSSCENFCPLINKYFYKLYINITVKNYSQKLRLSAKNFLGKCEQLHFLFSESATLKQSYFTNSYYR